MKNRSISKVPFFAMFVATVFMGVACATGEGSLDQPGENEEDEAYLAGRTCAVTPNPIEVSAPGQLSGNKFGSGTKLRVVVTSPSGSQTLSVVASSSGSFTTPLSGFSTAGKGNVSVYSTRWRRLRLARCEFQIVNVAVPVCGDGTCDGDESCSTCESDCGACEPTCGDGTCDEAEDCGSCESDCGKCAPSCGDLTCDSGESCSTCESDCGVCPSPCGNGVCDSAETCETCATDCGICPPTCGNHTCDSGETCSNCEHDCGSCPASCGNNACESGETCSSCAQDCGACAPVCGDFICNGTETCGSCAGDCGACPTSGWAFEETFNGDPSAPSQALLPRRFDYVATHRTHPAEPDGYDSTGSYGTFHADHGADCSPHPSMHEVSTTHRSNGTHPDESFFICKNHMMSSMGQVSGYSVTSFWPRQEFDFSDGGFLEFDVNINDDHGRMWWEILITPREQLRVGAAQEWLPISETFPKDRIVLSFSDRSTRQIQVGKDKIAPEGWTTEENDWREWRLWIDPTDPALNDHKIRRKMRIHFTDTAITWSVQKADGTFDDFTATLSEPLPFHRGLVVFKTHSYTPDKADNYHNFTFHWDNIRFDGPVLPPYEAYEAEGVLNLENNGNRPIGDSGTMTINLPHIGANPVLFGQVDHPKIGQVLVSVNGHPNLTLPADFFDDGCWMGGWTSFHLPIPANQLKVGTNVFTWTVGPRPSCLTWQWDGFSVKALEMQFDGKP